MAPSKDVLAVMGMLCVDRDFRKEFFADPRRAATHLVGELSEGELTQIDNLGGKGVVPEAMTRVAFVDQVRTHFDQLYADYNCPDPPCPWDPLSTTSAYGRTEVRAKRAVPPKGKRRTKARSK